MQVFAGSQLSHWDFPRNTASAALMTEFGRANGLAVADVLEGSGLSEADLHDHGRTIVGRQELAIATNLVDLLGAEAGAADLGIRVGAGYHVGSFGIFGFACLTSSTLGDTVRFAARYYELSYGFCLPTVTVDGPVAALRLDLPDLTGPVAEFLDPARPVGNRPGDGGGARAAPSRSPRSSSPARSPSRATMRPARRSA